MSRVSWRGKAIAASIEARAVHAINETTEEAAGLMQQNHWWSRRSDNNLERQVVTEPAGYDQDGRISGKVGATKQKGFYGLFLEREQPWIRPAGDEAFPHLADRLKEGR